MAGLLVMLAVTGLAANSGLPVLTDAQLLDYAAKLLKGDPSISSPNNREATRSVGLHHGVEVQASGVHCANCDVQVTAVYYLTPADGPQCREIGGQPIRYPYGSGRIEDRPWQDRQWIRLCVPEAILRAGLVGGGEPISTEEVTVVTTYR